VSYGCGHYMCRGDPGFFGNLLKAAVGTVGGALKGFIGGGGNPITGIIGAIGGSMHATASNIGSATLHAGDDPAGDARRMAAVHRAHAATLARAGTGLHPAHARALAAHAMGGEFPRRRRMRWTNPKALGRAERRIHSAVKHMTRYIRWVHPHKVGHAAPKFRHHKRK